MVPPSLTIIIPCFNELANLKSLLPGWLKFVETNNFKLILVNDGSKDGTNDFLNQYIGNRSLTVITHKVNKGYGGALKSGIKSADTDLVITMDSDGQHVVEEVISLYRYLLNSNADMVVGLRPRLSSDSFYRFIGKGIIRSTAKIMMQVSIKDLNSGFKIYKTSIAQSYLALCPDTMAFSDIITLLFINRKHLVLEKEIVIRPRELGESTINTLTALDTIFQVLNIVMLFSPIKIFSILSIISLTLGLAWGLPLVILGHGVSTGSAVAILSSVFFFLLGLVAEQISALRKQLIEKR